MSRRGSGIGAIVCVGLAVLLAAPGARAAWTKQRSGTGQNAGFFRISAADAQHAMAVGTHDKGDGSTEAVLAWTSDGGATWTTGMPNGGIANPMGMEMYTWVEMASPTVAFAGSMGKILSTTDGGSTWTGYKEADWGFLRGPTISGISFPTETTGFLAGSGGVIRKTTDQGATWTPVDPPYADAAMSGIVALDASHLWVTGGSSTTNPDTGETTGYEGGMLARSVDGGATWTVFFRDEPRNIVRLFMLNNSEGWMLSQSMSGPRFEHTTDGGATWTELAIPSGTQGAPDNALDIFFLDRCEGFLLVEATENTMLFYTTDRGATWTETDREQFFLARFLGMPIYARLAALDFPSRDAGFAGGFFEAILGYVADGAGPNCGGSIGPGGGGGSTDEGCGCRAAGAGGGFAGLLLLAGLGLEMVRRRRLRGAPTDQEGR